MGLGSTAKKVQKMVEMAEELYAKMNELRAQVRELRETVETTADRVSQLEAENERQRALVEALARENGIDVDSVLAEVDADDEEPENETTVSEEQGASGEVAGGEATDGGAEEGSATPESDA